MQLYFNFDHKFSLGSVELPQKDGPYWLDEGGMAWLARRGRDGLIGSMKEGWPDWLNEGGMAALRFLESLLGFWNYSNGFGVLPGYWSCSQDFGVKFYPTLHEKSFKGYFKTKNLKNGSATPSFLSLFRYLQGKKIANLSSSSMWRLYSIV